MAKEAEYDWVGRFADEVIAEADRRAPGQPVICASGLSPSGPIHLGNLREVMTPHLVADELRRRGRAVEHILSWDDFDRFRKVPAGVAGVDESWAQHIGKPLSCVPAPPGSPHPNWAEHFKAAMIEALDELGVVYRGISQTQMYSSGAYRDQILLAMRQRARIDAILDQYRTKGRVPAPAAPPRIDDADDAVAAAEAAEGSGAASENDGSSSSGYYPYRPYCGNCGTDNTVIVAYDDDSTVMTYNCQCGHSETVALSEFTRGKLVWKVDWPMRWSYEKVIFEPSGVDHSTPGSSYEVGGQIVTEIFGGWQPIGPMYAFVGISGQAKMSSSRGGAPTPGDALQIMEPQLLRWLYARRRPNQAIKVAFDQEIHRLYDEWDALERKMAEDSPALAPAERVAYGRSVRTAEKEFPRTPRQLPYRTLASIVDITTGHDEQILRIVRDLDPQRPIRTLDEVQPRLSKATAWVQTQLPAEARTSVLDQPDYKLLASLDDEQRRSLQLLADGLDEHWSLEGLTKLVYGVPKTMAGLPLDTPPTAELKVAQRKFFALVYQLLVGRDTGPRLPTLLLAVGADRVRSLITPGTEPGAQPGG